MIEAGDHKNCFPNSFSPLCLALGILNVNKEIERYTSFVDLIKNSLRIPDINWKFHRSVLFCEKIHNVLVLGG